MNQALISPQTLNPTRTRVLLGGFAIVAVAMGIFAVNASPQAALTLGIILLVSIAAITVPLTSLPVMLAALVPFQIYFFVMGTNFALHASVVFLAVAGLRLMVGRGLSASLRGQIWIAPMGLFLAAASIAAFAASSRYEAFKGIYEWIPIIACIFITASTAQSTSRFNLMISILVIGGILQATLGLLEYTAGLDHVLLALSSPLSDLIIQPNLLQERLPALSFNWILSERVLPFGTFINGIDYSIFIAAIILLAMANLISQSSRAKIGFWLACAVLMSVTLLLTLKASGFVALFGGMIALGFCLARRLSRRMGYLVPAVFVIGILIALFSADSISQRATFLIQREQDESSNVGRFRIWVDLLSYFTERPVFGYGLNNSQFIAEPMRTLRGGVFALNPTSPESAYVETLIETGAVGFIALMSLFALALVRAYRRAHIGASSTQYAGVFAALVAILLGNLTVSAFTTEQNGMLMGILIGVVFAGRDTP